MAEPGFCCFELDSSQQQGKKTPDRTVIAEQEFVVVVVFWPSQRIDSVRIPFELFSGYTLEDERAELAVLAPGIQNDFTYYVEAASRRIQVVNGA
jgi:hypothetical protein